MARPDRRERSPARDAERRCTARENGSGVRGATEGQGHDRDLQGATLKHPEVQCSEQTAARPVRRTRCPSAKVPAVIAASCARSAGMAGFSSADGDRPVRDAPCAAPAQATATTSAAATGTRMARCIAASLMPAEAALRCFILGL